MSEEIKRDSELGRKIHSIACKITDTIFEAGGLNDIKVKGNLKLLYPGIASLIINGIKEAFVLCKRPTETTEDKEINEDNCVLNELELDFLDILSSTTREYCKKNAVRKEMPEISKFTKTLFQKIKRLNDLAKEKK